MSEIRIVNWLLTRKCNLRCSYCGIVRNYKDKPKAYPNMKYYYENEMSTSFVINCLEKFYNHNSDMFHIFYGGEPLLREDLAEIVVYCNKKGIHYTIITNNSEEVQDKLEDLMISVPYISGLTSSIDPLIFSDEEFSDRMKKSTQGLINLSKYKGIIKDLVAEITVDNNNVEYLYSLVKYLSDYNISSSITFIDIAKTPYYDFSNVSDKSLLVSRTKILEEQIDLIQKENLDVHMGSNFLNKIINILPSEMDCKIENNLHNLSIDADGTVRLCLRIKGSIGVFPADKIFLKDKEISPFLNSFIKKNKKELCRKCNWTCMLMSNIVEKNPSLSEIVMHREKRI